jgi:hypothetical protein
VVRKARCDFDGVHFVDGVRGTVRGRGLVVRGSVNGVAGDQGEQAQAVKAGRDGEAQCGGGSGLWPPAADIW